MIIDIAAAVADYLLSNIEAVTGSGAEVPVYHKSYPQGCAKVAVLVQASPGGAPDPYLLDVENLVVMVWARAETSEQALQLMSNVDMLLHRQVNRRLSSTVFAYLMLRTSSPQPLDSENNDLMRYFCTYSIKAEYRTE